MYGQTTKYEKNKAIDALEVISLSSLEGPFTALLKTIKKLETEYTKRFIKQTHTRHGRYCDKDGPREVQYHRIWVEIGSDYDGERELMVWGERDQHDDERTYLREDHKRRAAEEEETQRASYERLRKKYEKGAT